MTLRSQKTRQRGTFQINGALRQLKDFHIVSVKSQLVPGRFLH